MEVMYGKCAGLDVHKDSVVACVRDSRGATGEVLQGNIWDDNRSVTEAKRVGLVEYSVTHVAMEATGVYWKPVWHILDGEFELVLANAMHIKNVPRAEDRR